MTRTVKVVIVGGNRHARLLAQAVIAASLPVSIVPPENPLKATHRNDATGSRRRAQWKDETNKRGRSR